MRGEPIREWLRVRITTKRAAALYFLLLLVLFADVLFFQRTLDPGAFVPDELGITGERYYGPEFCNDAGAVVWAFHPWNEWIHTSLFEEGEVALWNPFQGTGVPLAANFQSGVFSPLQWPFFLINADLWWDCLYVFRLLLAGFFAFMFLKLWAVSDLGAWLAGAFFMLCGYFIDYVNMNHLSVELLIPLCFFALERFLRRQDRSSYLLAAGALSLSILGGMPEATVFLWLFLGAYSAFRLHHEGRLRLALGTTSLFLVSPLTAMILLLPGLEYLSLSHSKHFLEQWGAFDFSAQTIVGWFVPFFFGPAGPQGWHPAITKAFHVPTGVGVVAIALSLLALVGSTSRVRLFFGFWLALGAAKLFGVPGIDLLGRLPLLETLIFTKYLQPSIAFSVAVLAGLGFDALYGGAKGRFRVLCFSSSGIALLIVALSGFYFSEIVGSGKPVVAASVTFCIFFSLLVCSAVFYAGWISPRRAGAAAAILFVAGAVEVMGLAVRIHPPRGDSTEAGVIERIRLESAGQRIFGDYVLFPNTATSHRIADLRVLDPLLPARLGRLSRQWRGERMASLLSFRQMQDYEHLLLDLLGVAYMVSTADLRNLFLRQHPLAEDLRRAPLSPSGPEVELIAIPLPAQFRFPLSAGGRDPAARVRFEGEGAFRVRAEAEGVLLFDAEGGSGQVFEQRIDLSRFQGRTVEVHFEGAGETGRIWAAWVPLDGEESTLRFLWRDEGTGIRMFRRPSALPLAFLVPEWERGESGEDALDKIGRHDFNARRVVVLEDYPATEGGYEAGRRLAEREAVAGREVKTVKRTANSLELEVQSPRAGFLVLSQTFYPGWKARIEGDAVPLYRADFLLTALEVPPGRSRVSLEFEPESVRLGAVLSLFGLFLTLLAGWFLPARMKARPPEVEP